MKTLKSLKLNVLSKSLPLSLITVLTFVVPNLALAESKMDQKTDQKIDNATEAHTKHHKHHKKAQESGGTIMRDDNLKYEKKLEEPKLTPPAPKTNPQPPTPGSTMTHEPEGGTRMDIPKP